MLFFLEKNVLKFLSFLESSLSQHTSLRAVNTCHNQHKEPNENRFFTKKNFLRGPGNMVNGASGISR